MVKGMKQSDELVLILIGVVALGALVVRAGDLWVHARGWATRHGVVLGAAADPVIPIPGWGGAGLDLARCAIAMALLLAAAALVATGERMPMRRRDEDARGSGRRWRR